MGQSADRIYSVVFCWHCQLVAGVLAGERRLEREEPILLW